uniref:p12-like1 protein n=1 Tax=Hyposoter didymator TaxID=260305 RepID=B9W4A3_HYPDD|nr:unknown [Hyposoter didymator]CAR31591.1 p12-like1 protein [Hyposoter didymator]
MSYLSLGSSVLGASLSVLTCYEVFQVEVTEGNKKNLLIAKVASVASATSSLVSGGINVYDMIQSDDSSSKYLDLNAS